MKLECPNCHTTFQVDENHYAALLSQVKNKEFESELKQRMKELAEVQKAEAKARDLKAEKDLADKMAVKDKEIGCLAREIERLRGLIDNNDLQKKADKAAAARPADIQRGCCLAPARMRSEDVAGRPQHNTHGCRSHRHSR